MTETTQHELHIDEAAEEALWERIRPIESDLEVLSVIVETLGCAHAGAPEALDEARSQLDDLYEQMNRLYTDAGLHADAECAESEEEHEHETDVEDGELEPFAGMHADTRYILQNMMATGDADLWARVIARLSCEHLAIAQEAAMAVQDRLEVLGLELDLIGIPLHMR